MDPIKIYDYLTMARQRVLDAVRLVSPQQYHQPFPFGLKTIAATLTHIMISEWYYIERLEGRTIPPYDQWPIHYESPPAFEVVESTWRPQMSNVRASIAAQPGRGGWGRVIEYDSFPDEQGRRFHVTATAGDFFTQLALHEVHHRAQVMTMLRMLPGAGAGARPVQDIDYNDLMYERRELT